MITDRATFTGEEFYRFHQEVNHLAKECWPVASSIFALCNIIESGGDTVDFRFLGDHGAPGMPRLISRFAQVADRIPAIERDCLELKPHLNRAHLWAIEHYGHSFIETPPLKFACASGHEMMVHCCSKLGEMFSKAANDKRLLTKDDQAIIQRVLSLNTRQVLDAALAVGVDDVEFAACGVIGEMYADLEATAIFEWGNFNPLKPKVSQSIKNVKQLLDHLFETHQVPKNLAEFTPICEQYGIDLPCDVDSFMAAKSQAKSRYLKKPK